MRGGALLVGGAVLAAFALVHRAADARAAESAADAPEGSEQGDGLTALDWLDPWGGITRQVEQYQTESAMPDTNMQAFLAAIEYAEGTARGGRDPYRTCYGYRHTIADLSDHPAVTGEWKGEPLDSLGAAYAGKVSTAAGRFQIIRATWLEAKRALSLPDFSPDSQDRAAVYLVKRRGALDDVRAGRFDDAVRKCAAEWASLPGANYGQPERKLAALRDAFVTAGGAIA